MEERWQGGPIALAGQAIVNFLDFNVFSRQGPRRWLSVLVEIASHFLDRTVRPANANLDRWDTMNNLLVARRKPPAAPSSRS